MLSLTSPQRVQVFRLQENLVCKFSCDLKRCTCWGAPWCSRLWSLYVADTAIKTRSGCDSCSAYPKAFDIEDRMYVYFGVMVHRYENGYDHLGCVSVLCGSRTLPPYAYLVPNEVHYAHHATATCTLQHGYGNVLDTRGLGVIVKHRLRHVSCKHFTSAACRIDHLRR